MTEYGERIGGLAGTLKIKLQLYLGNEIAFGPGKAALLHAIEDTGSISEAAKSMGMSYRRAWLLVDVMNRCFKQPLVSARPGRGTRSGAHVTEMGRSVLETYEHLSADAAQVAKSGQMAQFEEMLRARPMPAGG